VKNIAKSLIIGWSIVWAAALIGLANLKFSGHSVVIKLFTSHEGLSVQPIVYLAPIYALGIWIIGCILSVVIVWVIKRLVNDLE
jgi:hypothetical protein